MDGGHVSRPDFGMPQPDPAHPLTEFYCLLQRALDREGVFALPALYAQFRAPARRIYADEAADFLTLSPDEEAGSARLLAPAQLQLLYSSLHVMPDGAPAALLLTEECTRTVYAVQLLPPFVWEDPLPPLPDAPAALSLTLTMRDVEEIDACPAALGHRLACDKAGKRWLHHPRAETYLSERVAPLPAALPITEQKLSGSFAKTWRQMALLFWAYSCYTLGTLCDAGRKIFPLCTINCNNRGRSSVYRVNVPNKR